jgi:hypothetical protein
MDARQLSKLIDVIVMMFQSIVQITNSWSITSIGYFKDSAGLSNNDLLERISPRGCMMKIDFLTHGND